MRLVWDDPQVPAWVASHIPQMTGAADFGPCQAVGVVGEDGAALGGVVFHNWQPRFRNVEVSFASTSPRWLTRNLICGILSYPYAQLGCARITAITPRKATSARRFLDVFGFKREGLVRWGFGTDHAVISGLLRTEFEASRWARRATPEKGEHGKVSANASAGSGSDRGRGRANRVERGDGSISVAAQ